MAGETNIPIQIIKIKCLPGVADEIQRRKIKTNKRIAQRYKGVCMFLNLSRSYKDILPSIITNYFHHFACDRMCP